MLGVRVSKCENLLLKIFQGSSMILKDLHEDLHEDLYPQGSFIFLPRSLRIFKEMVGSTW